MEKAPHLNQENLHNLVVASVIVVAVTVAYPVVAAQNAVWVTQNAARDTKDGICARQNAVYLVFNTYYSLLTNY